MGRTDIAAIAVLCTTLLIQAAQAQHDPRAPLSSDIVTEVSSEPVPIEDPAAAPADEPASADDPASLPTGDFASFVPSAGFTTAGDTVPDTELVKRLFTLGYSDQCNWAIGGGTGGVEPEVWDLTYRDSYQEADEPDRSFRLYRFDCNAGAYNFSSVYLTWDSISGLKPLSFATPDFEIDYEDGDSDGKVLGIASKGMTGTNELVNSWFDPDGKTIGSYAKWRGIGDASDGGVWVQSGPNFVLDRFDVDASYNDAYDPMRIVADGKLLAVPEQLPAEPFDAGTEDQTDAQ